jgi:hypothetical protein
MAGSKRTRKSTAAVGDRFGQWIVIGPPVLGDHRHYYVPCRCACGVERSVHSTNLHNGSSTSCGHGRAVKHGAARGYTYTAEYTTWHHIRQRCENPNNSRYADYGGRGIAICARWTDFVAFLADMGPRPSPRHSIDRINVDGPYSPDNCRWATPVEQMRNRRNNHWVTVGNESLTVSEWAERTGMDHNTIATRLTRGWEPADAVSRPVLSRYANRARTGGP